jgi:hypothetical protein
MQVNEKFKKIDKEYLITDSSLNSYSYRLLTSGYQLAEFKKNPIGYYMHGTTEFPREMGVLVKWDDLRVDGDKVYGKPCVNLTHPRGQRTVDEIENGFLNGASVGRIVALEMSSNPDDYLPGQTGPTVTKWFNRECSPCDMPGNYNALSELVDENDTPINLADFSIQKINMEKIFLTAVQLQKLPNLSATPTQADVDKAFNDLIERAGKVDGMQSTINALTQEKTTLTTELQNLKTADSTKKVTDMLTEALTGKEKKITKELHDLFAEQFKGNPDGLKKVLDATPVITSVVKNLNDTKGDAGELAKKSWDELDKSGRLTDLKAKDEDAFFDKYKDKFNKKHPEDKR